MILQAEYLFLLFFCFFPPLYFCDLFFVDRNDFFLGKSVELQLLFCVTDLFFNSQVLNYFFL